MEETDRHITNKFSNETENDIQAIQNMLDISLDIICTIDAEGKFQYLSKSCFDILGYTPQELVGQEFIKFVYPDDVAKTIKEATDIQSGIYTTSFENRYIHKKGKIVPIMWSARWDYKTKLMYCVAKDATEVKKLEAEKEQERINKEALINGTDTLIWSFDEHLNLLSANEAFINSVNEFTGRVIKKGQFLMDEDFFNPQHLSFWKVPYNEVLSGKSTNFELEVPDANNNETIWLKTEIKPIIENNKIVGGVCRTFDITSSKKDEIEIKQLNTQLKEAQRFARLGYWEVSLNKKFLYWSDEVYRIWEIDKEAVLPDYEAFINTIHPEDLTNYLSTHEKVIKEKKLLDGIEYRIITQQGTVKWVREVGLLIKDGGPNKNKLKGIVQDVTQQKKIEEELKNRNQFIESIFQHIPMGIAVNKIEEGTALLMNKEFSNTYGWPEHDLTDVSTFFTKIYPDNDYREKMVKQITADMQSGDINKMQWKGISITTETGAQRYVDAKNIPLIDQNLMISTVIDVSEKMHSKIAMETALNEKKMVLESISDAFYALNENFEFTYINQSALELFNKEDKNFLGKNLFTVFPELQKTIFYDYLLESKEKNKSCSFEFYYEQYGLWFDENIYPSQNGFSVFF